MPYNALPNVLYTVRLIYISTVILSSIVLIGLAVGLAFLDQDYLEDRINVASGSFIYLLVTGYLIYRQRIAIAAVMLITFYFCISILAVLQWGINAPMGILAAGFVILLVSIIFGERWIFPAAITVTSSFIIVQLLIVHHQVNPDTSQLSRSPTILDLVGYILFFGIFALIAGLSRRQLTNALESALSAEAALEIQKQKLSNTIEEQSESLLEAKIEEMKHLYRFAELGQLTTIVLHDLANQLSVLILDIENVHEQANNKDEILRAKESIAYIESMINQVRRQLDHEHVEDFDAIPTVVRAVDSMRLKAHKVHIKLVVYRPPKKVRHILSGDPLRLTQVIVILITNAIQASKQHPKKQPRFIKIRIAVINASLRICVVDYGIGIPEHKREAIFEPSQTTKVGGHGIGLFIARKVIETHFHGKLQLSNDLHETCFMIDLPIE